MTDRPRRCGTCRKGILREVVLPSYGMDYAYCGRIQHVELQDYRVQQCDQTDCAAIVLNEAANHVMDRVIRDSIGQPQPDEIRARRTRLGLAVAELAAALGVSTEQMDRWECGGQLMSPSEIKMLRAFFTVPSFREYLLPAAAAVAS